MRDISSVCISAAIGLGSSGCGAVPPPFATATPTSTSTPTSTPTPQSTATATATATPLPTGVQAIKQTDGSTLVVDYEDKFQFNLSGEWLVLTTVAGPNPTAKFGQDFLSESGLDASALANFLNHFDLNTLRAAAILRDRKYDANGVPANITVDVNDDKSQVALSIDKLVAAAQNDLYQYDRVNLNIRWAASPNPNGVEFRTLDTLGILSGNRVIRTSSVFFKPDGKVCLISLYTHYAANQTEQLSPAIDMVISTLKPLGP